MKSKLRVGLVLAGGGAKGAYQAGAIRALARHGIECAAISAVGTGALNGMIVAASPDLTVAASQLERMWRQVVVAPDSALQIGPVPVLRLGVYLSLLFASGSSPAVHEVLRQGASRSMAVARRARKSRTGEPSGAEGILDLADVIVEMLNVSTDMDFDMLLSTTFAQAARNIRIPFFVSAFQSGEGILDHLKLALQGVGVINPGNPTYLAIHKLAPELRLPAVLASATLPFACSAQEVGTRRYVDGSFGGMTESPGAIPIAPLYDELVDPIIVVHSDGTSSWDATRARGAAVLELRPSRSPSQSGVGYFWADDDDLLDWIELGDEDTDRSLQPFLREQRLEARIGEAVKMRQKATRWLDEDESTTD